MRECGFFFPSPKVNHAHRGYKIRNQAAAHFLTFTVVGWIDVFTRQPYKDILLDNTRYCQQKRGLVVHAWCLMSNHIHLVAKAGKKDLSDVIRDFKKESARLFTGPFIFRKTDYTHQNPVDAGIVDKAEDYLYMKGNATLRLL